MDWRWAYAIMPLFFVGVCLELQGLALLLQTNAFVCKDHHAADCHSDAVEHETAEFAKWAQSAALLSSLFTAGTLGAVADARGRRVPHALAMLSFALLGVTGLAAFQFRASWRAVLIVGALLSGLAGSISTGFMAGFSLAADVTSASNRGLVFGVLEVANGLGQMTGSYVAGKLANSVGVKWVYALEVAVGMVGLLYALLIPESLPVALREPFTWAKANTMGSVMSLCRRRHSKSTTPRALRWLIVAFFCYFVVIVANIVVAVEFTEQVFGWNDTQVGRFYTANAGARSILGLCLLPLGRFIHTERGETRIISAVCFLAALQYAAMGAFPTVWVFVTVNVLFSLPTALTFGYIRGLFSKSVGAEQGEVLSGIAAMELVGSLVCTLGMNAVFGATNSWHAGFVWYLCAGLCVLAAAAAIVPRWTTAVEDNKGLTEGLLPVKAINS